MDVSTGVTVIRKLEPHAIEVELHSSRHPVLVAFLKPNERYGRQTDVLWQVLQRHGEAIHCLLFDPDYLDTAMRQYRVGGTPTFLLFSSGQEVGRLMGESDEETLDEFISRALAPRPA